MDKEAGVSTPTWPKAQNPASPPTAALLRIWFLTFEIQNTDRCFHSDHLNRIITDIQQISFILFDWNLLPSNQNFWFRRRIKRVNLKRLLIAFHMIRVVFFHKFAFHLYQYRRFLVLLFRCKLHDDDQWVRQFQASPGYPSYGQRYYFVQHHLQ